MSLHDSFHLSRNKAKAKATKQKTKPKRCEMPKKTRNAKQLVEPNKIERKKNEFPNQSSSWELEFHGIICNFFLSPFQLYIGRQSHSMYTVVMILQGDGKIGKSM